MKRRDFQEVTLSLSAPGTLVVDDSREPSHSSAPPSFSIRRQSSLDNDQLQRRPAVQRQHRLVGSTQSLHTSTRSSRSSTSTLRESDTDTADYESTPVTNLSASTRPKDRADISSVARNKGSPVVATRPSEARKSKSTGAKVGNFVNKSKVSVLGRIVSSVSRENSSKFHQSASPSPTSATVHQPVQGEAQPQMEVESLEKRVDDWIVGLKAALQLDAQDQQEDALEAYNRLNRQITKGAIYDYEQLTCDQKKLLSHVLTCLDQRTQYLKINLKGSRGQINTPGYASAAPTSRELTSVSPEGVALKELNKCVEVLQTISRMVSKARVPVVLVYRERKHRTHHRHEEKGQSNKVVFAKEKRDFLSLLGLPGAMISEKGIDFTVRPNTASVNKRQRESLKNNNATDATDVGEMEPDEKNGGAAVQTDLDDSESPKTTRKILQQYLPFKKKGSVSPQPDDSTTEDAESDTKEEEEEFADVRSTLSCDSCSSDESNETDDESDINTDTTVSEIYAHQESVKPPPFCEMGFTYVVLAMEKLGVKNTARLVSPFVRVSIRDPQGELVGAGAMQDTAVWEVVNKNYLRAPSQVHLQRALEELPDDMAIFLELRHHRPERGVVSTLCYTFLERQDLSNGEFVCELYNPPVDYTRKALNTYTEKAFFLHLEVMLKMAKCEVESLESPQSLTSS
nr:uncharacterized protein LOC123761743 [Procambarus clarkii]